MSRLGYVLIIFFLVPLQITLGAIPGLWNVGPDLTLMALYLVGLTGGRAFYMGIALGSIMDLFSGGLLGLNILTKSLIGFFSEMIGKRIVSVRPVIHLGTILALTVSNDIFMLLLLNLFSTGNYAAGLWRQLLLQSAYNLLLGFPFILIIQRRLGAEEPLLDILKRI